MRNILCNTVDVVKISLFYRCGRTDKGVSAFEQVISITLRSKCRVGVGVEPPQCPPTDTTPHLQTPSHTDDTPELNYVLLLNRGEDKDSCTVLITVFHNSHLTSVIFVVGGGGGNLVGY